MDGQADLVIAIGKRAKAKQREAEGIDGDEAGPEESETDVEAIKEDAARDVAKALGVDPEGVDLGALATALCDLMDAHSLKPTKAAKG